MVGFSIIDPLDRDWGKGGHCINPPGTILNAEIMAIEAGLAFWKDKGTGRIKVFSNSIEAIHALRTDHEYTGIEESSIKRANDLINDPLVTRVYYYPRANNMKAHLLAKEASRSPHPHAWVGVDSSRPLGR